MCFQKYLLEFDKMLSLGFTHKNSLVFFFWFQMVFYESSLVFLVCILWSLFKCPNWKGLFSFQYKELKFAPLYSIVTLNPTWDTNEWVTLIGCIYRTWYTKNLNFIWGWRISIKKNQKIIQLSNSHAKLRVKTNINKNIYL